MGLGKNINDVGMKILNSLGLWYPVSRQAEGEIHHDPISQNNFSPDASQDSLIDLSSPPVYNVNGDDVLENAIYKAIVAICSRESRLEYVQNTVNDQPGSLLQHVETFPSFTNNHNGGGGSNARDDAVEVVITKRCESVNTMASFIWWIIGFYWVVSGGEVLLRSARRLYWLAVIFLAFDVFFAIFCVVLACLIGIALCCCLPCIIAILYAVAGQEGASEADLSILPKYTFQISSEEEKQSIGAGRMVPLETHSGYLANEQTLLPEDAECCICLNSYEDGTELHALPCNHHYHSTCIVKWLKTNATCPLCKYNILKGNEQV
ncbi:unnamed protein product [Ilex paraguariensis]|uniref:RING-type E3 ubiquitin transferase n=1 Tax=Ilex paraguariensis TaxID=185542 RepID=A0ABC8QS87_9AQUA